MKAEKGLTPVGAAPAALNGKPPVPGKAEAAKAEADAADDGPDKHVVPKKVSDSSCAGGMELQALSDEWMNSLFRMLTSANARRIAGSSWRLSDVHTR